MIVNKIGKTIYNHTRIQFNSHKWGITMITFFYKYIAIFFVLILVSSIFGTLGQNGRELDAADGTGTATIIDDTVPVSRGGRAASTIELGSPLSLPEVDGNWTQDNWSAGSGQDQWSNPRKYSTGENVDHSAADGRLEIAKNQEIETWRYINDGPGARYRHSAAWDTNSNKMYIYGGFAGWGGARDNLFAYNAVTDEWTEKESYSPGRVGHTAVWDTLNNRMLVFGGRDSSNFPFGDLLAYNPIANNWTELNSSGP